MKRPICVLTLTCLAILCGGAGCSSLHKSDSAALQGTWQGSEIGGRTEGVCWLIIAANAVEFRGANTNEWYKGTFTLRQDTTPLQVIATIMQCPFAQYIGKTTHGIYRLEGGKLTFTANEPGNPEVPTGFDAHGSRRFTFKKQ